MPTDILPGYVYNPDTARYRDSSSGKFVGRSAINDLLRTQVQGAESRLHDLATAYHENRISAASFVDMVRTESRRLELQNVALAKGGFDRLDFSDFGRVGASLRAQYAQIAGTAQDVADGKVSLPQLLNRMNAYAGEGRRLYFQTQRENAPQTAEGMTTIERRLLGNADHCPDCLDYYSQGWQPVGVLPSPGDSCQCRNNCRCSMTSREVPTSELDNWIGTKN